MIFNETVSSFIGWNQTPQPGLNSGISVAQGYYPRSCVSGYTQSMVPHYGTITGADSYFQTRLNSQQWEWAERKDKVSALLMATRIIEALNFRGQKANSKQILFFPRSIDVPGFIDAGADGLSWDGTISDFSRWYGSPGGIIPRWFQNSGFTLIPYWWDSPSILGYPPIVPDPIPVGTPIVPGEIEVACYEIALCLLNGWDPEIEARNLSVTSSGYAGARSSYDRSFLQAHLRAGVPSALAWSILRPYLNDPQALRITRGA